MLRQAMQTVSSQLVANSYCPKWLNF